MAIELFDFINEEQLVTLSLYALASLENLDEDNPAFKISLDVITAYVLQELESKGENYNPKDISDRINTLLVNYALSDLTRKGIVEANFTENGTITYGLTELGKKDV